MKYRIDEYGDTKGAKMYSVRKQAEIPENLQGLVDEHWETVAVYKYKAAAERKLQKLQKGAV